MEYNKPESKIKVELYDTTLRDGLQMTGISLSLQDKLMLTEMIVEQLEIPYIEIYPFSNPKDKELIKLVEKSAPQRRQHLISFGATHKLKYLPAKDPNLLAIAEANLPFATIFGKCWIPHLVSIGASQAENLALISNSVQFLKAHNMQVFFDAEHFFDGYKDNPEYALKAINAAQQAGADKIILCDTNGGALPQEIDEIGQIVLDCIKIDLGIHAHNDSGLAVANSLAFLHVCSKNHRNCQIQGTLNGIGERCGNANLFTLIPILKEKLGYPIITHQHFNQLTSLSRKFAEISNMKFPTNAPFVGDNAFSHKGGMHIAAMQKNSLLYEHINPSLIGNMRRYVVSEMAGRSALIQKMDSFGIPITPSDPLLPVILAKIKHQEALGYTYEVAEASLEILIRSLMESGENAVDFYRLKFFAVDYFRVIIDARDLFTPEHLSIYTDASIKTSLGGKDPKQQFHTAEAGNGPVNALDNALRKALVSFYPILREIELTDYKVRICNVLNDEGGTASRVRVLVETTDLDGQIWNTVGVHVNIILASFMALVDSFIFKLLKHNQFHIEGHFAEITIGGDFKE